MKPAVSRTVNATQLTKDTQTVNGNPIFIRYKHGGIWTSAVLGGEDTAPTALDEYVKHFVTDSLGARYKHFFFLLVSKY